MFSFGGTFPLVGSPKRVSEARVVHGDSRALLALDGEQPAMAVVRLAANIRALLLHLAVDFFVIVHTFRLIG